MSWNANDLEHLTLIDRVKRLERSTLKPNEDGGYDETAPSLTEQVLELYQKVIDLMPIYRQTNDQVTSLGDILCDMLNIPKNSEREDYPVIGSTLCDVYQLTFDAYDDTNPLEGHSLIYIPKDNNVIILFKIGVIGVSNSSPEFYALEHDSVVTSYISSLSGFYYRLLLRKVATDVLYQHDYS